jgi:hypothetical protein
MYMYPLLFNSAFLNFTFLHVNACRTRVPFYFSCSINPHCSRWRSQILATIRAAPLMFLLIRPDPTEIFPSPVHVIISFRFSRRTTVLKINKIPYLNRFSFLVFSAHTASLYALYMADEHNKTDLKWENINKRRFITADNAGCCCKIINNRTLLRREMPFVRQRCQTLAGAR